MVGARREEGTEVKKSCAVVINYAAAGYQLNERRQWCHCDHHKTGAGTLEARPIAAPLLADFVFRGAQGRADRIKRLTFDEP